MPAATRVYIARLAGVAVLDRGGELVGRVRDVVATLRIGTALPRVLGFVVEIQHRRRIFIPVGRMMSVDADAVVLATGTVNVRPFEKRRTETLVLGEVLDRRVTVTATGTPAVVVDAAMEPMPNRDWVISRVAVRETGRLPRRRGQLHQMPWNAVSGLGLAEGEQGAEYLVALLAGQRPADVAAAMHDLSIKRRLEVADALEDRRLADVLEQLPEAEQSAIIVGLPDERAADVIEVMDPDDAADLMAALAEDDRERLMRLMEPEEAEPVRQLMTYREGTAGALMTNEPVILPPDATVAEALARARSPELSPALAAQVYVCRPPSATPTGRYIGTAHFQALLREPPSTLLGNVVDESVDPLHPDAPLAEVTKHLAAYDIVALAIVDDENRLVGAVTVDDILDTMLPADWRGRTLHG